MLGVLFLGCCFFLVCQKECVHLFRGGWQRGGVGVGGEEILIKQRGCLGGANENKKDINRGEKKCGVVVQGWNGGRVITCFVVIISIQTCTSSSRLQGLTSHHTFWPLCWLEICLCLLAPETSQKQILSTYPVGTGTRNQAPTRTCTNPSRSIFIGAPHKQDKQNAPPAHY